MLSKTIWTHALCLIALAPVTAIAQDAPMEDPSAAVAWSEQIQGPAPAASAGSFAELSAPRRKSSPAISQPPERPAFLLPLAGLAALLFVARRHNSSQSSPLPAAKTPRQQRRSRFGALETDAT